MPFNSVRACPEDSKKLPLRGKTSPAPGQILPGRGEMSPQVTKGGVWHGVSRDWEGLPIAAVLRPHQFPAVIFYDKECFYTAP